MQGLCHVLFNISPKKALLSRWFPFSRLVGYVSFLKGTWNTYCTSPGMILQVAHLKECAHDSTPCPAACWCELSHYGHLVCFFLKGNQGQWMEWNDFVFFLLPQKILFQITKKILYIYIYTWYFWKDTPQLFSDFFCQMEPLKGFIRLGLIHAKLPILPWPRLIQQGGMALKFWLVA